MGAGGWNKGLKNVNGGGFSGHHHSDESIAKLKNRPSSIYNKPKATPIESTDLCEYGCGQVAKFKFANSKKCCSNSHNSCPKKRNDFSKRDDHSERAQKSLATRIETGVTKETGRKAKEANLASGHYNRMRVRMQEKWDNDPWENNPIRCPLLPYKDTELNYQGSYEFNFLEQLEQEKGIDWIINNVKRGPSIWYMDHGTKRLYISDFIIEDTIYEIKSGWTWNNLGKDLLLEAKNKAKLSQCVDDGYTVILILDGKEIKWH